MGRLFIFALIAFGIGGAGFFFENPILAILGNTAGWFIAGIMTGRNYRG